MSDAPADPCARCGYALHGIADDAACPECGLLAERSRQRSDHLADATPRWLRGIARGVTLILIAHLLAAAWPFLMNPLYEWAYDVRWRQSVAPRIGGSVLNGFGNGFYFEAILSFIQLAGFDLAAILLAIGAWLLTRPQGRPASDAADRRWRRTLRIVAFVPLAVLVYLHARWAMPASTRGGFSHVEAWTIALVVAIGCAAIAPLMFFHLRRLAQRVLHPGLAEHAAIVGVGFAVALLIVPAVTYVMDRYEQRMSGTSMLPIILVLVMLVPLILFAGWSALNCVRFIVAFRKAYRGARGKWSAADRARG